MTGLTCVHLIEKTSYRCVREKHHFGDCVDQFGFTGRKVITRREARRQKREVYRAKLYAANLVRAMFPQHTCRC